MPGLSCVNPALTISANEGVSHNRNVPELRLLEMRQSARRQTCPRGQVICSHYGDRQEARSLLPLSGGYLLRRKFSVMVKKHGKISNAVRHLAPVQDPAKTVRVSGLRYIADAIPGIRRTQSGQGFRYFDTGGKPLRNLREL